MNDLNKKKRILYFLPFILLASTGALFYLLPHFMGKNLSYLSAFLFYWIFWCFIVPVKLIGIREVFHLFKIQKPVFGKHPFRNGLFLLLPLVLVYTYEFPAVIKQVNPNVVILSAGIALVNATAEEILWRGTFLKILANSKFTIPFSSFGFAIWHFAPQIIYPNKHPGGSFSFVLVAFLLGLAYSYVAKDTKSILLSTISHILFDFSGLGARIYF